MSNTGDILLEFNRIWADQNEIYSKQAKVVSVDESKRVCTVEPVDGGGNVIDVRLEADYDINSSGEAIASVSKGFFVVPTVNSQVLITFMTKEDAYLSAWTTITKIVSKQGEWVFNDGTNGGLIILADLVSRLNDYESLFNQLQTDFNTWVPVPADGGLALQTILLTGFLTKSVPTSTVGNFENTNVKH